MEIKTHQRINREFCGTPIKIEKHSALVEMTTTKKMTVDDPGLIHGGFIFGLADHAAMLALNHPNVVLAGSSCKFLLPLVPGEKVTAAASVSKEEKNRFTVAVVVKRGDEMVFTGDFFCAVLQNHVLGDSP